MKCKNEASACDEDKNTCEQRQTLIDETEKERSKECADPDSDKCKSLASDLEKLNLCHSKASCIKPTPEPETSETDNKKDVAYTMTIAGAATAAATFLI